MPCMYRQLFGDDNLCLLISTEFVHKIKGFAVEDAICPASGQNKGNNNDNDNNDNVQRSAAGWGGRQSSIYLLQQVRLTRKARGGKE